MLKFKVISIASLLFEVILFWIIWLVAGYLWINGMDIYVDILKFVIIIVMVIIIITALLIIIKTINKLFSIKSSKVRNIGLMILLVCGLTIHILLYYSMSSFGYNNSGLYCITNKEIVSESYYFYIESPKNNYVRIKCTKDIFDKLIIDKNVLYTFSYRGLAYNTNKGVLNGSIDISDIIDNR